ncbi:MAG: copper amine oxidase N-terminal domain-containing protein [Peptococcaceae bacterium]|nr:copper amine oxidase N-terminal domain-containing protein [Peptococcaceae bacterium]
MLTAGCIQPAEAVDYEASPDQSVITTGASNTHAYPYHSFPVTIQLKNAAGNAISSTPPGKVYIWATDENDEIVTDLDVVDRSLASKVYIHQTSRQGVLIMDAASLKTSQRFSLTLTTSGSYELHALYMPTGNIDPNNVTNYWPFELTGGSAAHRTIIIDATPASDVAIMVVSSTIRGLSADSFAINNPRNQTISSSISLDTSTTVKTEVQLQLLRSNGTNVGADVPVYLNTASEIVSLSNVMVRTDENGIARFTINGQATDSTTLELRCSLSDQPVVVPLSEYVYRPRTVEFNIGSTSMNVDDRPIQMDTAPVVKGGRTYVPFRAIGELLGARVEYNNSVRTITTYYDDRVLTMSVGYNHYAIDGKVYQMDAVPYINSDGRTMVPIRFVAEFIGYSVQAYSNDQGLTSRVTFTRGY